MATSKKGPALGKDFVQSTCRNRGHTGAFFALYSDSSSILTLTPANDKKSPWPLLSSLAALDPANCSPATNRFAVSMGYRRSRGARSMVFGSWKTGGTSTFNDNETPFSIPVGALHLEKFVGSELS